MSERDEARRATKILYGNRFEGMPNITPTYAGDFPCQMVAEKTAITDYPDLADHQTCWNRLYSNFEKAWNAFHMEQS